MKALSIAFASLFMSIVMVVAGYSSFVDAEIEKEIETEFVVEFNENVDINSDAVAKVTNMANATYKARPYEGFYVFTVEDSSYEQLQSICASIEELPEVKEAHTKWSK